MTNAKSPAMIGSLQVGMGVLDIISSQTHPLKFTEIQELTQITKSNLYKYLNTLTHLDLLHKDKKTGAYTLGPKMIAYGMAAIGQQELVARVTPYLQESSRHTSLTTLLAVWTHSGPVIASICSTTTGLNIGAQIGTRLPILSSSGKIFSAFQSLSVAAEWKQSELQAIHNNQKEILEQEEKVIQSQMIAFAKEPLVPHVSSASVPILNYSNELMGCLTVVGFSEIVPKHIEDPTSQYLLQLSTDISNIFGYKPV